MSHIDIYRQTQNQIQKFFILMEQKSLNKEMEKNRQQYLQYFQRPIKTQGQNRRGSPKGKQNNFRAINHNYKDYHQILENSRLLKRILNPKRDPTIMQSLRREAKTHKSRRRIKPLNSQQKNCEQIFLAKFKGNSYFENQINQHSWYRSNVLNLEQGQNLCSTLECRNSRSLYTVAYQSGKVNSPKEKRNIRNIKKEVQIKQKNFQRSLENERMGKRIINTRSVISTIMNNSFGKTSLKFAEKNGSSCHNFFDPRMNIIIGQRYRKINNGVKVFFNNQKEKQVINSGFFEAVEQNEQPQLTIFQTYGTGPTILRLSNFDLKLNPKLKDDTVIALELMKQQHKQKAVDSFENGIGKQKNHAKERQMRQKTLFKTHRLTEKEKDIKRKIYEQQNSTKNSHRRYSHMHVTNSTGFNKMLSHSFTYKQMVTPGFNIKFAVNLTIQGEYLPLRIWQYNGVESKELGIVDINVIPYLKKQISKDVCIVQEKMKDGEIFKRKFFQGNVQKEKMRKSKKQEIIGTVSLKYQIYNKKYRKKTEIQEAK